MKTSLLKIIQKRFSLFLKGDRNGVSLGFLSIGSDGVFLNVDSLAKAESEISPMVSNYVLEAENLFTPIVSKQPKVTNLRWNAEQQLLPETSNAYIGSGNWNFHLLNSKNTYKQIVNEVSKLPKVDIWVHDSNHGYRWQKFEYLLALKSLNTGGILISDDIDASSAWTELSRSHFRKSYIIFDSRKFIGIAFK